MKSFKWYEWAMLAVLTLMAALGLALSPLGQTVLNSDSAPAWIQAVGSVAAILVASLIARHQTTVAKAEEARRRMLHLQAIQGLLRELNRTLVTTADAIAPLTTYNAVDYARHRIRPMRTAIEAIQKIPFHEVPMAYIGVKGLNFLNMFEHALSYVEMIAAADANTSDEGEIQKIARGISRVVMHAERAQADLDGIRQLVAAYDGQRSPDVTVSDL